MGLDMVIARNIATHYGLGDGDHEAEMFRICWKMRKEADEYARARADEIDAEIAKGFDRFVGAVRGKPAAAKGHALVKRLPVAGRYVVFSDHHWAFEGHRQNFFLNSGNQAMYCELLAEYLAAGYTLVENGDVEELLVMEPTLAEIRRREGMNWAELREHRLGYRLALAKRILDDAANTALYARLGEFHAAGRYVKIAGNHDTDLQRDECLAVLRRHFDGIDAPYDYLFLEGEPGAGGARPVRWAVMHGHQFDVSTNPRFAPYIGELVSETVSWAYQGADRVWRWNDQVREWATGALPFRNSLVTDDYDHRHCPVFDTISAALGILHQAEGWEGVFKHNIAWEYFENSDPQKAFRMEVKTGDEFFKFRHLDERFVRQQLLAKFTAAERPRLVLGHSHEVRFHPTDAEHRPQGTFEPYYNSGAAGRFENLIWGLEIEDGTPRLVGWSRPDDAHGKPDRQARPQRRVYRNEERPAGNRLFASAQPMPLPA